MAISYITVAELRDGTQNNSLKDESNSTLESLIERSERFIDSIAGFWEKYDEDQTRKFPRVQDVNSSGVTFIPDMIKEATISQCEFMYLQTPDDEHGIKQDDSKGKIAVVSPRARSVLTAGGFMNRTGKILLRSKTYNPDKL